MNSAFQKNQGIPFEVDKQHIQRTNLTYVSKAS